MKTTWPQLSNPLRTNHRFTRSTECLGVLRSPVLHSTGLMYNTIVDDIYRALSASESCNYVIMSSTEYLIFTSSALPQLFDQDSRFGQVIYQALEEQGAEVELKSSFFLNGMEGDVIGFESIDNLYQEPEYRVIESASQFKSVCNLILQNLSQIEVECDLKNALEMCHVAISFKVLNSEINFVFLPVFPKNFRISENYSSWVQLKSILKSGDAGSPSRGTAISSFFKYKLLGARTNFVLFVESSPEKFIQSTTILDEASKLLIDLRSQSGSRRGQDESIHNSRIQHSDRSSQHQASFDLDLFSKQVIQEINEFLFRADDIIENFEHSPSALRPQGEELKKQIDILEQKVEIANESSKGAAMKQKLIKSQKQLSQLRETLDIILSTSRKDMQKPSYASHNDHGRLSMLQSTQKHASPRHAAPGLPPRSIAHTKKKSAEFDSLKKFRGEDYKRRLVLNSRVGGAGRS